MRVSARASLIGALVVAALGLAFLAGWWTATYRRAHDWNKTALRATLDAAWLEGDKGHGSPVFFFTVENTTPDDYTLPKESDLSVYLRDKDTLDTSWLEAITIGRPVFIPAHQKATVQVHFKLFDDAQPREPSQEELQAFVRDPRREWGRDKSFVLFDKARHYQVDFPIVFSAK